MYKNELWVVVSADFDDISDRTFVISRRTFALLIESVHLHLLLCHNSHGHLILHISPCVPRDPDRARSQINVNMFARERQRGVRTPIGGRPEPGYRIYITNSHSRVVGQIGPAN